MNNNIKNTLRLIASELAYSTCEIAAGIEFADRKARHSHPSGEWDSAGRFYCDERTAAVENCRSPSRAWPFSEMTAARTAAHCAELCNAECVTHVRRLGSALDKLAADEPESRVRQFLTPGVRKRVASVAEGASSAK